MCRSTAQNPLQAEFPPHARAKKECVSEIESFRNDIEHCRTLQAAPSSFLDERTRALEDLGHKVNEYNSVFVHQQKNDYDHLWRKGSLSLEEEQQDAVVTDDKHNMVVAAAGSGKTEVLITRIAYLVTRRPKGIQPRRILAIAYQRKATEEVRKRLLDRYDLTQVHVTTFHKLGKDILARAGRNIGVGEIVNDNLKHRMMDKITRDAIGDDDVFRLFLRYMKTVHDEEKEQSNQREKARPNEVVKYALQRDYHALDNTRVNSRAEKEILDFFLANKINNDAIRVEYEPRVGGFRPDFYLPQLDIYIEHWALNENGETPEWFSQSTAE